MLLIFLPNLFALFAVVACGVSSLVERLILAYVQNRISISNSPVFGFATMLLDGIKLFFSKIVLVLGDRLFFRSAFFSVALRSIILCS